LGDRYFDDDRFLAESYLAHVGPKPTRNVRLSSFDFLKSSVSQTDFRTARRRFLWFGGSGLVLKGLDRALEAFAAVEDLELYVCGPVEENEAFVDEYHEELYASETVHLEGYVNVRSERFAELTRSCGWVLNPSGSGVALPGAVITCMHRGVVPIVTTEFEPPPVDWGVVLPDASVETVRETARNVATGPSEACATMARRAHEKAVENYMKATFRSDLEAALREFLPAVRQGRSD